MSDYKRVEEALASGAEPEMLCATCPWDRICVEPPSMTKQDYEKLQAESKAKDEEHAKEAQERGETPGMPLGSLITAIAFGGAERRGTLCPVFSLRLRSAEGRKISDALKALLTESA